MLKIVEKGSNFRFQFEVTLLMLKNVKCVLQIIKQHLHNVGHSMQAFKRLLPLHTIE